MINILFIGDIFGRPGRLLVRELLPDLINRYQVDLVVANVENASGGVGLTIKAAEDLFRAGVNVMTSGNHIFKHKEIIEYLEENERLLRPVNYPEPAPGRGTALVETSGRIKVGIVNLLGRVFMAPVDCPFRAADREVTALKESGAQVILFDIHAEATSEKIALSRYLDGRIGALIGTHTHVQTADEAVLPNGLAYLTDAGMTGPHDSVIGMRQEAIIERFLTARPVRFQAAKKGLRLEGAVISFKPETGCAENITRIRESFPLER
ncbi:MAG: TIGR00282 family metallophosphoesterase [Deltaproteobacteria bacterium]|nr:TIGR00282 family metallophosphoesterase [Deltaproteobacteria bacterium]MBW2052143.1 TIGR00282 family metallophosphoesterase [Deltaproteobacteria bacterium]MBW2140637.1 TIGR00282 family metallophosphoesterase [Deltaproteobacteria bacterium]